MPDPSIRAFIEQQAQSFVNVGLNDLRMELKMALQHIHGEIGRVESKIGATATQNFYPSSGGGPGMALGLALAFEFAFFLCGPSMS